MGNGRSPSAKAYLRTLLFEKQGGRCCYCAHLIFIRGHQSEATFPFRTKKGAVIPTYRATFEHIRRVADGGTHRRGNLALACHACNSQRGKADWLSYKTRMMGEEAV
jgi:5-methylcytosine-specific restriction endonuclease McrA